MLRDEVSFVRDVHVTPLQRCLRALDRAYKAFWTGQAGPPTPRKKHLHNAFSHTGREIRVETLNAKWSRVKIPKIGWMKFRRTRDIPDNIREATISRTPLGWSISFGCVVPDSGKETSDVVGIDRGVDMPLALSDGRAFGSDMKKRLAQLDQRARFLQRRVSRRK